MSTNDAALIRALIYNRATQQQPQKASGPYDDIVKRQLAARLMNGQQPNQGGGALNAGGMDALGDLGGMGMEALGGMGGGGGGGGGMGGGSGGGGMPWDMLFSGLGRAHGAIDGNDPNSPMVPHERQKTGDEWLVKAGAPIGGAVGSMFGFGQSGSLAGQNVGATLADLKAGNINNLGLDVSQNLPPIPGMKQPGWKGLVNGATGLPFGTLFGKLFG